MKIPKISFFTGMGSVLNIWGRSWDFKYSKDDYEALASDWRVVGNDIRKAMGQSNPVGYKMIPTKNPGP